MGQAIAQVVGDRNSFHLLGGSSENSSDLRAFNAADVIIDFSSLAGNQKLFKLMSTHTSKTLVIGTTGLAEKTLRQWQELASIKKHRILFAPNTSIGIYLLMQEVGRMAKVLIPAEFDIEIIETHHNRKKDAPSGTALLLARAIQKEFPAYKIINNHSGLRTPKSIGVHAVRGGGVFGEHVVRFISEHEEVTIGHRAFSRALFAHGALNLAEKIHAKKSAGFFTLENL